MKNSDTDVTGLKHCSGCKQMLGEAEFSPSVWVRVGGACRKCHLSYSKKSKPRIKRDHPGFIRCSSCFEVLGQDRFTPSSWLAGNGKCKECHHKTYGSVAGPEARKTLAAYTRVRRAKRAEYVQRVKHERGCMFCGENHPAALDFHHRDKEHKVATIAHLVQTQRSLDVIDEEMAKCDIVCANCHRKLHYQEGGTSYWSKATRNTPEVVERAERLREKRNRNYPVALKLA